MSRVLALYLHFPNPDRDDGPDEQEIYLNAREGLLRVLELVSGDVPDACLRETNEELEARISDAEEHSDALVHWTFVQIMDLSQI